VFNPILRGVEGEKVEEEEVVVMVVEVEVEDNGEERICPTRGKGRVRMMEEEEEVAVAVINGREAGKHLREKREAVEEGAVEVAVVVEVEEARKMVVTVKTYLTVLLLFLTRVIINGCLSRMQAPLILPRRRSSLS